MMPLFPSEIDDVNRAMPSTGNHKLLLMRPFTTLAMVNIPQG